MDDGRGLHALRACGYTPLPHYGAHICCTRTRTYHTRCLLLCTGRRTLRFVPHLYSCILCAFAVYACAVPPTPLHIYTLPPHTRITQFGLVAANSGCVTTPHGLHALATRLRLYTAARVVTFPHPAFYLNRHYRPSHTVYGAHAPTLHVRLRFIHTAVPCRLPRDALPRTFLHHTPARTPSFNTVFAGIKLVVLNSRVAFAHVAPIFAALRYTFCIPL